jgi:hypothetical protein
MRMSPATPKKTLHIPLCRQASKKKSVGRHCRDSDMRPDSSIPLALHQHRYRKNSLGGDAFGLCSHALQAAEDSLGFLAGWPRIDHPSVKAPEEQRHGARQVHAL